MHPARVQTDQDAAPVRGFQATQSFFIVGSQNVSGMEPASELRARGRGVWCALMVAGTIWTPDRRDVIWINFSPQVGREFSDMHPMKELSPALSNCAHPS